MEEEHMLSTTTLTVLLSVTSPPIPIPHRAPTEGMYRDVAALLDPRRGLRLPQRHDVDDDETRPSGPYKL
jgi:hypothetical protein